MKDYIEFNKHTNQYPIVLISKKIKDLQFVKVSDELVGVELKISKPEKKKLFKPIEPSSYKVEYINKPNLVIKDGCGLLLIIIIGIILGWNLGNTFLSKITFFLFILGFLLLYRFILSLFSNDFDIKITNKLELIKIPLSEEIVKKQREEYEKNLEKYYSDFEKTEKDFKIELEKYNSIIELNRKKITKDIYLRSLKPNIKATRGELSPKRGRAELEFLVKLNNHLKEYIFVDMVPQLNSNRNSRTYNPDFTLICPKTGLHIDIEIDEPYSFQNKTPIHYIGCGDNERDNFFLELNWCVIRFTEKQIIENTSECIKTIQSVYDNLINMSSGYDNFLKSEPKWSYEEALIMQNKSYREKYLKY